ncbi:unnamed protein product [Closterium sp. Naga37s-1]|nr:unnamed protein product [Closterium sp. Naga37s-1]
MAKPVHSSQSYSSSESAAVMARAAFVDPFAPVTRKAVSGPLAPPQQQQQQQQQQQRLCVSGPLYRDSRLAAPSYSDAAQQEQQLQQLAGPASSFATTPLAELWWGTAPSADAMAVAEAVWGAHAAQHHAMLAPHPASPSLASPSNAPIEATGAAGGCWEWAEAGAMAAVADEEEQPHTMAGKRAGRGSRYMRRDFKKNRPNEWNRPRRDERPAQPGAEDGEAGGASGGAWKAFVLENEAFETYYKVIGWRIV